MISHELVSFDTPTIDYYFQNYSWPELQVHQSNSILHEVALSTSTNEISKPFRWVWILSAIWILSLYCTTKSSTCSAGIKKYPHWDRILGLDLLYRFVKAIRGNRFLELTTDICSQFGPTFQVIQMGRPVIITTDPENIRAILSTRFKDFGLGEHRQQMFKPLLRDGIFNVEGDAWRKTKSCLKPILGRQQPNEFKVFQTNAAQVIRTVEAVGGNVDLQSLFACLALDSALMNFCGMSVGCLDTYGRTGEVHPFAVALTYVGEHVLGMHQFDFKTMIKDAWKGESTLTRHLRIIDQFVDKIIDFGYASNDLTSLERSERTLLQIIIEDAQSREEIRDTLLNVFVASRDTQTALLSNVWFVLARHPLVWTKAREEVTRLGSCLETNADLHQLKYLRNVVNEALRLYPPVPINVRTALADTVLPTGGGPTETEPIHVPEGTSISFSTFGLHRRKDIWGPDADMCNPDRWNTVRPGWAFLPFLGGPRRCPGQEFALRQTLYTTAYMISSLSSIKPLDYQPWTESLGANVCSKFGVKVKLSSCHELGG